MTSYDQRVSDRRLHLCAWSQNASRDQQHCTMSRIAARCKRKVNWKARRKGFKKRFRVQAKVMTPTAIFNELNSNKWILEPLQTMRMARLPSWGRKGSLVKSDRNLKRDGCSPDMGQEAVEQSLIHNLCSREHLYYGLLHLRMFCSWPGQEGWACGDDAQARRGGFPSW